jgi:hypothetical protein
MGAMQGWGRLTVALMSAFPAVLAGKGAVLTLVMVAALVALMVWQLTMASKSGTCGARLLDLAWPGPGQCCGCDHP